MLIVLPTQIYEYDFFVMILNVSNKKQTKKEC